MKTIQTKDEAIQTVIDNNPTEYSKVLSFAQDWIKTREKPFTAEDLKTEFYKSGNPDVYQPNVFGAVFNTMSRKSLISVKETKSAKLPLAHGRLLRVWVSNAFEEVKKAIAPTEKYAQQTLFT